MINKVKIAAFVHESSELLAASRISLKRLTEENKECVVFNFRSLVEGILTHISQAFPRQITE